MKPSEIIDAVERLGNDAVSAQHRAADHDIQAETLRTHAKALLQLRSAILVRIDAGEPWSAVEAMLATHIEAPEIEVREEQPIKRERKQRADAGKPRGPKGGVREGRVSPLTDERRDMLNLAFKMGPTTLAALTLDVNNMSKSGATPVIERDVEGWLCEDPEAYVSWTGKREGDPAPVTLWGTWEQFFATYFNRFPGAAGLPQFHDTIEACRLISDAFGCSAAVARRAILQASKP